MPGVRVRSIKIGAPGLGAPLYYLLLALLHFDDGDGEEPMGLPMGIDDGGGVGGLGKTKDGPILLVHPVVDKVYSIFLLDGKVFLVGGGDGGGGDVAGPKLVDVEVEVVISFYHTFLTRGHLVDIVREEAVGFGMGRADGLGVGGGGEAIDVAFAFIDPIFDEADVVLLFDGEVFLMGAGDSGGGDLAGAEVMNVDVEVGSVGCLGLDVTGKGNNKHSGKENPACDSKVLHTNSDLSVINELLRQNNSFFGGGI